LVSDICVPCTLSATSTDLLEKMALGLVFPLSISALTMPKFSSVVPEKEPVYPEYSKIGKTTKLYISTISIMVRKDIADHQSHPYYPEKVLFAIK
jgi:hypothetical protein